MHHLFLVCVIIFIPLQSVVKKFYTEKTQGKGTYAFSAMVSLVALIFFAVTEKGFEWNIEYLPYSIGFGVSYILANIFTIYALATGMISLTTLVLKYSLIFPAIYGIMLGESVSIYLFVGIALLLISMFLINKPQKGEKGSFKWLVFVLLALLGNGICSITQKMHQQVFGTNYKNEFMIVALTISFIVSVILAFYTEGKMVKCYMKSGIIPAVLCGLTNGAVNFLVMILNDHIPASVMFPLISACGAVIVYFISRFYYKEKFSKSQFIGLIVGISSIILLSL